MIFVDTSVWVAALGDAATREAAQMKALLDADEVALSIPVYLEILSGAARSQRAKLKTLLGALPLLYPTEQTWQRMEEWVEIAGEKGERFGIADLLIGAIAAERDSPVWSLDAEFSRMARLRFLKLYGSA